jgi:pimeloyl-ACP methyl ester carboxylesterase
MFPRRICFIARIGLENRGASPRLPCSFTATMNRASCGSDGYHGWDKSFDCCGRICRDLDNLGFRQVSNGRFRVLPHSQHGSSTRLALSRRTSLVPKPVARLRCSLRLTIRLAPAHLQSSAAPASVISISNPSSIPQRDRLGSAASKEMIEYWNNMFVTAPEEGTKGLRKALSKFDLARDGILQRIAAPTLVVTADRSALQSVEKVRQYQLLIPNSRLVVLHSDAYHIAAANADECVANVLAFIKETRQRT